MFTFCKIKRWVLLALLVVLPNLIFADDSKPVGKKSIGGSGQMIQFADAKDSSKLSGIEVHGSRYGTPEAPKEKFLIYVLDERMNKVTAVKMVPYSTFERGEEKWVSIKFDDPVVFPKDGWIVIDFRAAGTKGVYVSYDDSTAKHSKVGLPGIPAKNPEFKGNWMIRPIWE